MVAEDGWSSTRSTTLAVACHSTSASASRPIRAGRRSVAEPDSAITQTYKEIARKVAVRIAEKAKDMSLKMPTIKVSNT